MAAGALFVSASAVLIDLARVSPGTASFYRCLLALPALAPLAMLERGGRRQSAGGQVMTVLAGLLFAGDMLLWTAAIGEVGAGLSTVLVNVQVVIVPLLAWAVDREPVTRRFLLSLPPLLSGVVLAGGVLESGVGGSDPVLGMVHAVLAALCYSGYLFLLRRNSGEGRTLRAYLLVTVSAGTCSLVVGSWWHGVELAPGWAAVGWLALVALFGQVLGWLLVALASPRLHSHVGAILLLFTPVGAVALGALVLSERPTPLQLSGCVLILASACMATMGRRADRES